MGVIAKVKSSPSGGPSIPTIAAATVDGVITLTLNNESNVYRVTNTNTTVAKVMTPTIQPGRRITLIGNAQASMSFDTTANTTTRGEMDFGSNNFSFTNRKALEIIQMSDGTWRKATSGDSGNSDGGSVGTGVSVPDFDGSHVLLELDGDGATTMQTLGASDPIVPGRLVTVLNTSANTLTMQNNSNTTTAGQMDLRHNDRVLQLGSTVTLTQLATGAWRLVALAL